MAAALKASLDVSEMLAALLAARNIVEPEEATVFLQPRLVHLEDPFKVTHLDAAVERLRHAMAHQERMLIVGDYDVDGVTSVALLTRILRAFGADPIYQVPRRLEEGYGLSLAMIERALSEASPDLLIALDCGTNSVDEVASLRKQGVDVIIVDHHQSTDALPEDCILINPHVFDSPDCAWRNLCTVGLVFKLVHGLVKSFREAGNEVAQDIRLRDYLDLVSMGTIADLVPLRDENRIFTRFGLQALSKSKRPGVRALFEVSGLVQGQEVQPGDISFKLGPRINASGRLADAVRPLDMLLSDDLDASKAVALELNELNRQRQSIEKHVAQEAEHWVTKYQPDAFGMVTYHEDWHSGVVGIVAGKLARRFFRPSIVLGKEGEWAKGSGRSIPGINLVEILAECDEYLNSWGGHPMAVGVSLPLDRIDAFRCAFDEAVSIRFKEGMEEPTLQIDYWLNADQLDEACWEDLDLLRPFGEGNPEPIIGIRGAELYTSPVLFGDRHFRFQLPVAENKLIQGIAWNFADRLLASGELVDLAVKLQWNCWNGRKLPQLELVDWCPSKA